MFSDIVTGIIVTVLSAYILSWLNIGGSKTTASRQSNGATKLWKLFVVIGYFMIIGGALYGLSWAAASGFESAKAALGLSLFVIGIPILLIGRFAIWWSRN